MSKKYYGSIQKYDIFSSLNLAFLFQRHKTPSNCGVMKFRGENFETEQIKSCHT